MRWLQPVIWSKGTYLTPQHLQQQDRFLESSFQFRVDSIHLRPWGFSRLQIDHEQLAAGTLALTAASGIFPDGLPFDIPGADSAPAAKPLDGVFGQDEDRLELLLAIPAYKHEGVNVSFTDGKADTRYRAAIGNFRDENTGLSERPIQLARKAFRLLSRSELREGMVALPVASLVRASGSYETQPDYIPPLIQFAANPHLVGLLRRLIETVSARITELSGTRRHRNQSTADFTPAETLNFWLLHTLNANFPILNHFYATRTGHPEELFQAMLGLAGALTTFSRDIHPRDLPVYNHEDLTTSFRTLNATLQVLLDTVLPANCVALPLKLVRESLYAVALDDERYLKETRLYLGMTAAGSVADVIAKAPQLLKVCSANHIEHLVRQALPGVPLTHMPTPPPGIPAKLNYQYFSLSQSGVAWEAILRARNVAAYVPADFAHPVLELIVLLPEAA